MTDLIQLPHQRLDSYKVAREICMRVYAAKISNAQLRDQAERAASSMFLQLAEGLEHLQKVYSKYIPEEAKKPSEAPSPGPATATSQPPAVDLGRP